MVLLSKIPLRPIRIRSGRAVSFSSSNLLRPRPRFLFGVEEKYHFEVEGPARATSIDTGAISTIGMSFDVFEEGRSAVYIVLRCTAGVDGLYFIRGKRGLWCGFPYYQVCQPYQPSINIKLTVADGGEATIGFLQLIDAHIKSWAQELMG